MDYKKVLKSQSVRVKILKLLRWLPDSIMLRIQYRLKMGFWPNFAHPIRFTEKIQLYKMKYRNPLMPLCVDKYEVRKYVDSKGLGGILNQLYGVYSGVDEIKFEELPNQFVIKSTSGGGGLNVIVIKDKLTCNIEEIRREIMSWRTHIPGTVNGGREWAYNNSPRTRIIIEKYLEDTTGAGKLSDYKLMFFNGKFRSLWIDRDRYTDHHRGFWDEKLCFLPNVYSDHETFMTPPDLPDSMQEMILAGEKLSEDFPYARVDMYDVNGKVIFGEITFYPWSGYVKFHPSEFDVQLGSYFTEYV